MNSQPHTHTLKISDYGWFWMIEYGDQISYLRKPFFFRRLREIKKLRHGIAKAIRKHDRASQRYGLTQTMAAQIIPSLTPNRWGSEQLPKPNLLSRLLPKGHRQHG